MNDWLYTPEACRKSAEARKSKIYGVGINDINRNLKGNKLYVVWKSMFARSYSTKFLASNPQYRGCSVDPRWHRLSDFKQWFDKNYKPGYQLDKDILNPGNKIYGPDTCVFVPEYVNRLFKPMLTTRKTCGVRKQFNRYLAQFRENGNTHRGSFETEQEAIDFYTSCKKLYLTKVAEQSFRRHEISTEI